MYFGSFCCTKLLFAWPLDIYHTYLQNMLPSLPDPQPLRNQKFINPILKNCNLKKARFEHFCLILGKILKIKQKYLNLASFLIAISQVWVDGFLISQWLWVGREYRQLLNVILNWYSDSIMFNSDKYLKIQHKTQFQVVMTVPWKVFNIWTYQLNSI